MAQFNLITWNIAWGRGCDGSVDLRRIVNSDTDAPDHQPVLLCLD